jgi:predicted ArsR family transcriptional regulator
MTALEQQSMVLEDRFQRLTEQYNETMEISASIDRRLKSLMSYIERL